MSRLIPLLFLAGCTAASPPTEPLAPSHQARVMSTACDPNYGRPRADITIQNTGATTVEYAKGIVSFSGAMNDGYFSPRPLRPGGMATLKVYGNMGDSPNCSLVSVQDGDGFPVTLSR